MANIVSAFMGNNKKLSGYVQFGQAVGMALAGKKAITAVDKFKNHFSKELDKLKFPKDEELLTHGINQKNKE